MKKYKIAKEREKVVNDIVLPIVNKNDYRTPLGPRAVISSYLTGPICYPKSDLFTISFFFFFLERTILTDI